MTLPSRFAALTLCATFLAGQPTVICDLACMLEGHRAADVPAGTMVMQSQDGHGAEMQCHVHQIRTHRVPPAALVVSASVPVTIETLPFPVETAPAGWRPVVSPAASAGRTIEPPPPRLR